MQTDLSKFTTGDYEEKFKLKTPIWFLINYYIFNSSLPWPYAFKRFLLILFGAKVGKGLIIKTRVRIKYPWRLTLGEHCWIGESVWIDNMENVDIGNHVSISQGAMLLTGNHDYTISHFPYRLGKIKIEDGVWIGAKSVVCPGIVCRSHSILTVNSVASKNMEAWKIYAGNPANHVRDRIMKC
ncbi:WcaF family extracellular polysaccharide biosynthesis acetyltransferase [Sabulibacter ruber]|uniref:WcaF family extracellular polysaccharide biosynthesis acetyltransferase n=1 Tax=Sabulibacter ruber TaxID=2811901 RepID=UPI001A96F3A0|nr:WcaF family extracellular polysaccharide biosynthesis acetyltransferase [Sabulibacter ruber]